MEGGTIIIPENIIKVNQRIDIIVERNDKEEVYHSRIEDITAKTMLLAMPMYKSRPILLFPNDRFLGKIVQEQCIYNFELTYLNKRFLPVPVWITTVPTDFRKIQQRSFVRVGNFIDCNVELFDEANETEIIDSFPAMTRNISGGGAQVSTEQKITIGTKLRLSFPIPDIMVQVKCRVVRTEYNRNTKIYRLGLQYLDMSTTMQGKLIQYIYQLQIEQKKREQLPHKGGNDE